MCRRSRLNTYLRSVHARAASSAHLFMLCCLGNWKWSSDLFLTLNKWRGLSQWSSLTESWCDVSVFPASLCAPCCHLLTLRIWPLRQRGYINVYGVLSMFLRMKPARHAQILWLLNILGTYSPPCDPRISLLCSAKQSWAAVRCVHTTDSFTGNYLFDNSLVRQQMDKRQLDNSAQKSSFLESEPLLLSRFSHTRTFFWCFWCKLKYRKYRKSRKKRIYNKHS